MIVIWSPCLSVGEEQLCPLQTSIVDFAPFPLLGLIFGGPDGGGAALILLAIP